MIIWGQVNSTNAQSLGENLTTVEWKKRQRRDVASQSSHVKKNVNYLTSSYRDYSRYNIWGTHVRWGFITIIYGLERNNSNLHLMQFFLSL